MFNISDFYYYSPNGDITNSVQRQNLPSYNPADPLWKRADERFFWNKALLDDLINSNVSLFNFSLCQSHWCGDMMWYSRYLQHFIAHISDYLLLTMQYMLYVLPKLAVTQTSSCHYFTTSLHC